MTEERIVQLETEVADLKRRLAAHEDMRSGAIEALAGVSTRIGRLQDRVAVTTHPALDAAREKGLLPKYSQLATRQRAVEEQFHELAGIVAEDHDVLREILALLRKDERP